MQINIKNYNLYCDKKLSIETFLNKLNLMFYHLYM